MPLGVGVLAGSGVGVSVGFGVGVFVAIGRGVSVGSGEGVLVGSGVDVVLGVLIHSRGGGVAICGSVTAVGVPRVPSSARTSGDNNKRAAVTDSSTREVTDLIIILSYIAPATATQQDEHE